MSTIDEMIADCRSELDEPSSTGHVSNYELANFGNHGQRLMALRIMEADPNFFEQSDQSLGFIADQEEYDLPGLLANRRITKLTRTDFSDRQAIDYVDFRKRDQFQPNGIYASGNASEGRYYYLRGNKLGLKPTPTSTIAANILIHFLQPPQDLLWAQVDSQSTTTFIIPTSTTATPPY